MRRTILSAVALACTAVLMGTAPAFADDPAPAPTVAAPAENAPSAGTEPNEAPAPAPSVSTPAPAAEPTRAPAGSQVSAVPEGAPDTGVAAPQSSGDDAGIVGAGAGAVLAAGAVLFVVRRRRAATGA
ncbi:LPXTG cell wall anchor domain-containing protein [Streptomyces sp. AC627_RSS907]|uniref:LPXTG cell wall anchor domain-containing protein n=1 Tax=Streptomyces sp. AC627_RSS907 TaxID=2823684 RepID=UPI001C244B24|nr:LPXTG cell wall anchor domain-containing protein [Streptomyces sp. AC627_RSS907]